MTILKFSCTAIILVQVHFYPFHLNYSGLVARPVTITRFTKHFLQQRQKAMNSSKQGPFSSIVGSAKTFLVHV